VVEIVFVHIRIEWHAGAHQLQVILGARQRREVEELEQIDRQAGPWQGCF
jgi:hypothetical protein